MMSLLSMQAKENDLSVMAHGKVAPSSYIVWTPFANTTTTTTTATTTTITTVLIVWQST